MIEPLRFSRIRYFCQGRKSPLDIRHDDTCQPSAGVPRNLHIPFPDDDNEDRIFLKDFRAGFSPGSIALAVADGVTHKTAWRFHGLPAGWHAANLLMHVLEDHFGRTITPGELWAKVLTSWHLFENTHACPLPETARATALLFNPFRVNEHQCGELWSVGDCLYGWVTADGTWVPSTAHFPANSLDADARAEAIDVALKTTKIVFPGDLQKEWRKSVYETGWQAMQDGRLQRAMGLAPPSPPHQLTMTTARWHQGFQIIPVPHGIKKLVLATDGALVPQPSIHDVHDLLRALADDDTWSIGKPFSPKNAARFNHLLYGYGTPAQHNLRHTKGFIDADGEKRKLLDDLAIIVATVTD